MCVESRDVGFLACGQKKRSVCEDLEGGVDMYRKLIVLALLLGLASVSSADILIGNYENSMSDNWAAGWEGGPTLSSDILGVGASLGDMSLQLHMTVANGYWTLMWSAPAVLDIYNVTAVKMDVTMLVTDPYDGEWNYEWTALDKMAINGDGAQGWEEYLPTAVDRITGNPVGNDWGSWSPDAYKTFTWDLSGNPYDTSDSNFLQLVFAIQNPVPGTGAFYIDNVRFVTTEVGDLTGVGVVMDPCLPEPMTIALLGTGGLALLRRKRA